MPLHEDCLEEGAKQSAESPGVVEDDEKLGRFVYRDDHVDEEGKLKTGAFQLRELTEYRRRGLSLTRLAYTSAEKLREAAAHFEAGGPDRQVRGLGVGITGEVRAIRGHKNRRALCVIDDGNAENAAHALAVLSKAYFEARVGSGLTERDLRPLLMPIREKLMELFSPVQAIDEIYPSLQEDIDRP